MIKVKEMQNNNLIILGYVIIENNLACRQEKGMDRKFSRWARSVWL